MILVKAALQPITPAPLLKPNWANRLIRKLQLMLTKFLVHHLVKVVSSEDFLLCCLQWLSISPVKHDNNRINSILLQPITSDKEMFSIAHIHNEMRYVRQDYHISQCHKRLSLYYSLPLQHAINQVRHNASEARQIKVCLYNAELMADAEQRHTYYSHYKYYGILIKSNESNIERTAMKL